MGKLKSEFTFKQKYDWDCSVASIYIVLRRNGLKLSYKELLDTTFRFFNTEDEDEDIRRKGIDSYQMLELLDYYNFEASNISYASFKDITTKLKKGYNALVGWHKEGGNHTSLVKSITSKNIIIEDTASETRTTRIDLDTFEINWFTLTQPDSKLDFVGNLDYYIDFREVTFCKKSF